MSLPTHDLKIAVFSDLHIVPEGEVSNTLDSTKRLRAGIAHFNARHDDADLVIIAGDLADLAEPAAYDRLQDTIADFAVAPELVLGNHDDRAVFLDRFGSAFADENGFVQKVIDIKGHRIILLDSTIPGSHAGQLCQKRLDWLRARLAEAADRPVIVVLHHHVVPLYTAVDDIILADPEALVDVLRGHSNVRQVISGHVHFNSVSHWKGIAFTTIAGSHYSVTPALKGAELGSQHLDGPGQYGLVLSGKDTTVVHFEDYLTRAALIAPENFGRQRAERR